MAQQRRFERQQDEIKKIREAKKNMDGKAEGTDLRASSDEEGQNPPAAETNSEEKWWITLMLRCFIGWW